MVDPAQHEHVRATTLAVLQDAGWLQALSERAFDEAKGRYGVRWEGAGAGAWEATLRAKPENLKPV